MWGERGCVVWWCEVWCGLRGDVVRCGGVWCEVWCGGERGCCGGVVCGEVWCGLRGDVWCGGVG